MYRALHSAYNDLVGFMPGRTGKALQRAVWKQRGHPTTFIHPSQHLPDGLGKGSVTFSLDFEMAWAWRYSKKNAHRAVELGLWERENFPRILEAFDSRRLPATWAVVGHLLLASCRRGANGRAHPEIPHIEPFETRMWTFNGPDWFQHDPCTCLSADPAWYAPDLVALLRDSPTGHEIASHTFSHMTLGPRCSHEVAVAELRASRDILRLNGVEPRTVIHPANDLGNFAAMAATGFSICRRYPSPEGEVSLPVLTPDKIWMVHGTACLQQGAEISPRQLRMERIRLELFVDTAMQTGLNVHFWLHPSIVRPQMEHVLFPLLDYCARLRDEQRLNVYTMQNIVAATAAASPGLPTSPGRSHAA